MKVFIDVKINMIQILFNLKLAYHELITTELYNIITINRLLLLSK